MIVACGSVFACGEEAEPPADVAEDAAPIDTTPGPTAPLVVPNGSPMPPAERTAGVPPYPGAVVWMRHDRRVTEFEAIEAFTPDPYEQVVAHYDSILTDGWRREEFADAVTYTKDPDMGAVMLMPWNASVLPADAPEPLRTAQTGIGVAWKKDLIE